MDDGTARQPWEQMEGEPHRWFQRFNSYRLMGPGRQLLTCYNNERVRKSLKESLNTSGRWKKISHLWQWETRARAWDRYMSALAEAEAEAKWKAQIMGATETLARLSEQARNNISTFISQEPKLMIRGSGEDAEEFYIESGSLNWDAIKENGHLIKKISFNQYGPIIETYSVQDALELMGKHHELFSDVNKHTGSVDVVQFTVDQWKAQQAERERQATETLALFADDAEGPDA